MTAVIIPVPIGDSVQVSQYQEAGILVRPKRRGRCSDGIPSVPTSLVSTVVMETLSMLIALVPDTPMMIRILGVHF